MKQKLQHIKEYRGLEDGSLYILGGLGVLTALIIAAHFAVLRLI